jgi:hypothetical protein
MLAVGTPRTPILRSVRAMEKPGLSVGTMKPEIARVPCCESVFAKAMTKSATVPPEI